MKTLLFLSLILLPFLLGYSPQNTHSANNPAPTPTPYKKPVDVERVDLDKTEIRLPCAPGFKPRSATSCDDDNKLVNVRTIVSKPEATTLKYKYTVTGGYIRGTGANVRWDLWEAPPGTYELTSSVDDGCGFCGAAKNVSINVVDCPECRTECPGITMNSPSDVEAGNPLVFTANISGGSQESSIYHWEVSAGQITSGQGTLSIEVSTTPEMVGTQVTATLKVRGNGDLCPKSYNLSHSATGSVKSNP
jgi:hypothetical protein